MSEILPSAKQRWDLVPSGYLILKEEKDDSADGNFLHKTSIFSIAGIDSFFFIPSALRWGGNRKMSPLLITLQMINYTI